MRYTGLRYFPTPVTPPSGDGYFLDDWSNVIMAFSTRKLRTEQPTTCYRIRRSIDNAELDIGYTSEGLVDTAAALAFYQGGSGHVVEWFGASSTGFNAIQATAASQPRIGNGSTPEMVNGQPSVFFNGSNALVVSDNEALRQTRNFMLMAVCRHTNNTSGTYFGKSSGTSGGASSYLLDWNSNNYRLVVWSNSSTAQVLQMSSGEGYQSLGLSEGHHQHGSPSKLRLFRDGAQINEADTVADIFTNTVGIQIGSRGGALRLQGHISELLISNTYDPTFAAAYRANVANHYGITM